MPLWPYLFYSVMDIKEHIEKEFGNFIESKTQTSPTCTRYMLKGFHTIFSIWHYLNSGVSFYLFPKDGSYSLSFVFNNEIKKYYLILETK